jgi:hypothetical protein
MLRQVVDSLAQQRDLDFGRPSIGRVLPELINQFLLPLQSYPHRSSVI